MDKVFYKYRTDSPFTESIITSGKVFLATAHHLNDPFECSLKDISKEWMDERVNEGMQASVAGFAMTALRAIKSGGDFFGLQPSATQAALDSVVSSGELEKSYDAWRVFMLERTGHPPSDIRAVLRKLDDQLVETGIFSMSSEPAQALMWAHYAGEHRGLCLGFRQIPGSKLADPAHLLPVTYSDKLPEMDGSGLQTTMAMAIDSSGRPYTSSFKLSFEDKTFQRVVTTKPTCWSYEQEFRYIEPFGGQCDWPGVLAECTFGLRCREDRRRHYIDLLETNVPNDVHLFEMRRKHGTNSLERLPLDPPLARSRCAVKPNRANKPEREQLSSNEFVARMEQLLQREDYGEVIFQTAENLKKSPSDPVLLHLKATAHGLAHEHQKAYEHFRELADDHPNVAAGWYGMACALTSMGQLDEVIPLLRRAYQLEPNDPSITLNLGVNLAQSQETLEEGLEFLERAEKLGHRRARQLIDRVKGASDHTGAGTA
jgi:hypothetical protein